MLEQAGKASRVCTYRYVALMVAAVFDLLVLFWPSEESISGV